MPSIAFKRNYSKTSSTPRRPYEKERLNQELKLLGEYGLRCKREIWRVQLALAKLRKAARELLTLDAKDPKRLFEGPAILRKMVRYGLLNEDEQELDFVLELSTPKVRAPPRPAVFLPHSGMPWCNRASSGLVLQCSRVSRCCCPTFGPAGGVPSPDLNAVLQLFFLPPSSWSGGCRPRCSRATLRSRSTTRVC